MNARFLFTGLLGLVSLSCSSTEEIREYINEQTDPFTRKHINYALYSKIDSGKQRVFFSFQIPVNEISFIQSDNTYKGMINTVLNVTNTEGAVVWDTLYSIEKSFSHFEDTRSHKVEKAHILIPVPSGQYKVDAIITDVYSKSDLRIRSGFTLNQPTDSILVSNVRFLDSPRPDDISLTKHIQLGQTDAPSMVFEVANLFSMDSRLSVRLFIHRFKTDTTVSRPVYGLNPLYGSVESRGYMPEKIFNQITVLDTVVSISQETLQFLVPLPESVNEGGYLTRLKVMKDNKVITHQQEQFFVFPKNHPDIKNINEAIGVVKYITTSTEYSRILEETSDSARQVKFEEFWLELADGNIKEAQKKIGIYFERAYTANMLFSNYKPGWKTDLGMIYIVFGPPDQVQWRPTELRWYYYSKLAGGNIPFVFEPIRKNDQIIGYSLFRVYEYDELWREYRKNWENL